MVTETDLRHLRRCASSPPDPPAPVRPLPIQQVVPGVEVDGPVPELAQQVRELHRRFHRAR